MMTAGSVLLDDEDRLVAALALAALRLRRGREIALALVFRRTHDALPAQRCALCPVSAVYPVEVGRTGDGATLGLQTGGDRAFALARPPGASGCLPSWPATPWTRPSTTRSRPIAPWCRACACVSEQATRPPLSAVDSRD